MKCAADKGCGKEKPDADFLVPEEETGVRERNHCKECRAKLAKQKGRFCKRKYDTVEDYCAKRATWGPLGCTSGGDYCGGHADKKTMFNLQSPKSSKNSSGTICKYGIGNGSTNPREFCGKVDCEYHYSYSFANFKGMMCGAKTEESCECLPGSCCPVVDCWDEKQNDENKPFNFAMKSNQNCWFLCRAGKDHPPFEKTLDQISRQCSDDDGTPICPACSRERQTENQTHTNEDFVPQATLVHGGWYSYEKTVYERATKKVIITCPEHGDFRQRPSTHLRGHGCSGCVYKTEAKFFEKMLSKYPELMRQFTAEWCKNIRVLPFDFGLLLQKILFEIDGPQHFRQVSNWTPPDEVQARDQYKMECTKANGYSVIRLVQEDVLFDKWDWFTAVCKLVDRLIETGELFHGYVPKPEI